jgi:hypothetical protein
MCDRCEALAGEMTAESLEQLRRSARISLAGMFAGAGGGLPPTRIRYLASYAAATALANVLAMGLGPKMTALGEQLAEELVTDIANKAKRPLAGCATCTPKKD